MCVGFWSQDCQTVPILGSHPESSGLPGNGWTQGREETESPYLGERSRA